MNIILSIIIFILGTAIGSFLSVIIHRLHTKKDSMILSRSMCPSCKKKIKWRHLVPVFSWLYLRGKCGYCREKISVHYLMLELVTGIVFLFTFLNFNFLESIPLISNPEFFNYQINWQVFEKFVFYIIEFSFLIGIFFYDTQYKEIPDQLSLPAIAIAIVGNLIFGEPEIMSMLIGAAGIFTFFLLQFVLSKGSWIGGGDLRLAILVGVLLGWEMGLLALIISYLLGGLFSIYLLIAKKVQRKTQIPFGPFLVTGIIIAVFYGNCILDWYFNGLFIEIS